MQEKLCNVLIEAADIAHCVGADMHQMHLNFIGEDFDTMHKEVLKEYYEQADDDYDELSEKARMYGFYIPTPTEAAKRIAWQVEAPQAVCRQCACERVTTILTVLIEKYRQYFVLFNNLDDAIAIGVANYFQTRLEYWTKELLYFNKSRYVEGTK